MTQEKVFEEIKYVVRETIPSAKILEDLSEDTRLIDDLGADSIALVSLVLALEQKFGILFGYENLSMDKINKLSDLRDYILVLLDK